MRRARGRGQEGILLRMVVCQRQSECPGSRDDFSWLWSIVLVGIVTSHWVYDDRVLWEFIGIVAHF